VAYKLSAYLWLRNNDFSRMLKDPYCQVRLSDSDKESLELILVEIDKLHEPSDMVDGGRGLVGPNVLIVDGTVVEVIERSKDRNRSGELFGKIHEILRKHFVNPEVYRRLGEAHRELGIEPNGEFAEAIGYMTEIDQYNRNALFAWGRSSFPGKIDRLCWDVEVKRKARDGRMQGYGRM